LAAYEYAAALATDKAVLEVGCNTGYGTAIVARSARAVVGVDVSPRCIERAGLSNAAPNIEYRTIDGSRLPFESGSFDLAISFQVIEHVFTMSPYLSEIARILKPGGSAIFTTPNACLRLDPGMTPWNPFHVREFTPPELESALAPWFPSVVLHGLFATDVLYDVEFRRLQRAREEARRRQERERRITWRLKRFAASAAKSILPVTTLSALRKRLHREPPPQTTLDPSILATYSTRDFFYKEGDFENALDLMAICARA
jgi:SAM-dependent methyltransferase